MHDVKTPVVEGNIASNIEVHIRNDQNCDCRPEFTGYKQNAIY